VRSRIAVLICAVLFSLPFFPSAHAADTKLISSVFSKLIPQPVLGNPSAIVMDEATGEIVYEKNINAPRKPASIMKVIAAAAAYTYLKPEATYTTTVYAGAESGTAVIQGSLDPWMSYDCKVASKMKRTCLGHIQSQALAAVKASNDGSTKSTKIYYSKLFTAEVDRINSYLKAQGASTKLVEISPAEVKAKGFTAKYTHSSPTLQTILDWTLTWSDNVLADRIARKAAAAAGNSTDAAGISKTFKTLLTNLGVTTQGLVVKDASGLSKENRVTAIQMAQLLKVIHDNAIFTPLIKGLPVSGISGTLETRFIKTAPNAIGLVRAKTGTLNGTANMAGYFESGDREFIFVIIADSLRKSYGAEKKARAAMDVILGKITSPLLPELLTNAPSSESTTATNN
jgi:D-alanyl-D-alanine carboxypeptidase